MQTLITLNDQFLKNEISKEDFFKKLNEIKLDYEEKRNERQEYREKHIE